MTTVRVRVSITPILFLNIGFILGHGTCPYRNTADVMCCLLCQTHSTNLLIYLIQDRHDKTL